MIIKNNKLKDTENILYINVSSYISKTLTITSLSGHKVASNCIISFIYYNMWFWLFLQERMIIKSVRGRG